ncbi:MAG TPA: HAD family phosphatase [Gammaproteobacteria bacterium]|nr:HAD family phosphatase [Gammaproteobacteria bacterium]
MGRFDLVIFDCDGVVVDSERIVFEVFGSFIRSLGVHLTDEETREQFLGRSLADCMKIVERFRGSPAPAGSLERYTADRDRVLRERVEPVAGIREVLESLKIPFCIASSGGHDKMRITLGATKLMPLFEGRLFSATEVPRAKPAPDIFLLATQRMGANPARTAVVEDSVNGVLAGCAAGMTVFGYVDLTPAEKLSAAGASFTFTQMRDLPGLLL